MPRQSRSIFLPILHRNNELSTLSVNRSGGWCLEIAALCHHRFRVPLKPQLLPTRRQAARTDHQAGLLAHQWAVDRHAAPVGRCMTQGIPPGMVTRGHNVGLNRPIVSSFSGTFEDVEFEGSSIPTSTDNRYLSISSIHTYTYVQCLNNHLPRNAILKLSFVMERHGMPCPVLPIQCHTRHFSTSIDHLTSTYKWCDIQSVLCKLVISCRKWVIKRKFATAKLDFKMPFSTVPEDTDLTSLRQAPGLKFLVFYSSIVDGQLWCPVQVQKQTRWPLVLNNQKDCRRVEQLVNHKLLSSGLDVIIVYVGDRHE